MRHEEFIEKLKIINKTALELLQDAYQEQYEKANRFKVLKGLNEDKKELPEENNEKLENKKLFKVAFVNGIPYEKAHKKDSNKNKDNEENGNIFSQYVQGKSDEELKNMLIKIPGISASSKPRSDGRYQGYITDKTGKKIYIYGRTKEEVIEKITDYIKNGLPKKKKGFVLRLPSPYIERRETEEKSKTPTLKEWGMKWFELYKKPNLKPKSAQNVECSLNNLIKAFGDTPLDQLNTDELQYYFLSFKAERTRDLCIGVLKNMLEKAKKRGIITQNPCDGLEIKPHEKKRRKGLTPEQQEILLNAVKGSLLEPIFVLLLTGGFRIGELLALTADDVDFEKNTVNINKNVVFINGERIVQKTKSEAGNRIIPLPAPSMKFVPKKDKGDLFPQTYNAIRCAFVKLSKKTGIRVSAHILRHTYSNRLEEAGIPAKVKQRLLGHANLDVTQNIYTDTQQHYVDRFINRILEAFYPENDDKT